METRLSNILKTTNAAKFIKAILESTYEVVLGKFNLTAPIWLVFLLRAVEVLALFDIYRVFQKKETFLTLDINLFSAKTYKHVVSKESLENCATGHISFDNMV